MTEQPAESPDQIPDRIEVEIPVGGRVLVVSDLRLTRAAAASEGLAVTELATAVDAWTGPGVVVCNGNLLASSHGPTGGPTDAGAVLGAHARLVDALRRFADGPGRRVVVLAGDRDALLGWHPAAARAVQRACGAELALAVELTIATGAGPRRVRVEPGRTYDPLAAPLDPRSPADSPMAQHLREQVIPAVRGDGGWLTGIDRLDDPGSFSRFLASRLTYRRLGRRAWLLLLPVAVAVALRLPGLALRQAPGNLVLALGVLSVVAELVILTLLALLAARSTWRAFDGISLGGRGVDANANARAAARDLVTAGHVGLVTGHTCRPELTGLGDGFYANTGCAAEVVTEVPARLPGLGLPPVFLAERQVAWVELESGNDLHVRLIHGRSDLAGMGLLERVAIRRGVDRAPSRELRPEVVAAWPQGASWPPPPADETSQRRIRRLAAVFVALAGLASLLSSLSDPLRDRLSDLRTVLPLVVPETAAAVAAVAGVGLLVLARGIRRGQHRAWVVTEVLLAVTVIAHLIKGVDIEESVVALAVGIFLAVQRRSFRAATERPRLRGGLAVVAAATALTMAAGAAGLELSLWLDGTRRRHPLHLSWTSAFQASVERMVGVDHVRLPSLLADFFDPAMAAASVALGLALVVLLFRPVVERRRRQPTADPGPGGGGDMARARAIVARHGSGTLDWFALRPDKQFFFWGDTVVAHAVYGGVCLVSPDPIGPQAEREEAWRAFRAHVDRHGWALGGLGAGEEWLPIYRATGMHDLYVGDEAVVRVDRFTLEGGRFKGLRQAVNRVAKHGYTISFHDPAHLEAPLRASLEAVMTKSRRGDVERGFSMTLGRVFQPEDTGLLLAVVHGPPAGGDGGAGPPVAFCQYVPAPGIGGWSLDLMRRDDGDHPNGLIDFAVVETIKHLAATGDRGLGLNFATMRAVLAGEAGEGLPQRVQAWLLRRMGDSMQIESLWKFNAKFDPDWQPRYAVYDAPENALAVAIAVARAESFWELPVIGRFLVPSVANPECVVAPDAVAR